MADPIETCRNVTAKKNDTKMMQIEKCNRVIGKLRMYVMSMARLSYVYGSMAHVYRNGCGEFRESREFPDA